jgi:hypothetical protein
MGFITDEWVRPGITTGSYGVAEVGFTLSRPTSQFSRRHGLVLRMRAQKADSDGYQVVHFDARDLLQVVVGSLREVEQTLRAELVTAVLGELSDAELLASLDAEVSRRRQGSEAA